METGSPSPSSVESLLVLDEAEPSFKFNFDSKQQANYQQHANKQKQCAFDLSSNVLSQSATELSSDGPAVFRVRTKSTPTASNNDLLKQHLIQKNHFFDKAVHNTSNGKVCLLSSKGLRRGSYEWTVRILKSDVDWQEIGVVGTADFDGIAIDERGVVATKALGARSVYGCELTSNSVYYASFNECGAKRCYRDLSPGLYISVLSM